MRLQPFIYRISILFAFMIMSLCFSVYAASPVKLTHVHGLNYSADGKKVFIPSHHGLAIYSEGHWSKAKGPAHDYMGFSVTKDAFYSSGHPAPGSPLKNPFGLIKSLDGGETWDKLGLMGESDFHLLATGYETNVVYVLNHAPNSRMDRPGLYYTADDGKKWNFAKKQGVNGNVTGIGAHPSDSNVVAVGTNAGLYLSKDKGDHFQPIKNGMQILSIFFELDQKHLWFSGFDGRVSLTRLNLETKKTEAITIPPMERDAVAYIAQNPVNHKEFTIATFKKDVYQSFDQGKTWKQIAKAGNT